MGTIDRILRFAGFGRKKKEPPKDWAPDSDYLKSMEFERFAAMHAEYIPEHEPFIEQQWMPLVGKAREAFEGIACEIRTSSKDIRYLHRTRAFDFGGQPHRVPRGGVRSLFPSTTSLVVFLRLDATFVHEAKIIVGYVGDDYFAAIVQITYKGVRAKPGGRLAAATFFRFTDVQRNLYFRCDGQAGVERLFGAVAGHIRQGSGWEEPVDLHGRPLGD